MHQPQIIYEDQNLLAVVKPAGMLVHGMKVANSAKEIEGKREQTLVDWLLERYPELREVGDDKIVRPGIVHRLDRETSGVMIVARTQKTFDYLKSLFQKHEIKKTYLAVASGAFKEKAGMIDVPIGLKNGTIKRTVHGGRMVKEAVTEYEVVKEMKAEKEEVSTLLKVMPKTGRTHQIRVHLASIGHPIVGDTIYGKRLKATKGASRLMLHALSIEFVSPEGKRMKFESETPEEFVVE